MCIRDRPCRGPRALAPEHSLGDSPSRDVGPAIAARASLPESARLGAQSEQRRPLGGPRSPSNA
eukprot:8298579-Alexandrium_andersonii.AAC.1